MGRCTAYSHQTFYLILFTLFTGFLFSSLDSLAQAEGPISGTVLDSAHHEVLAGVSVQIKGSRQGTSTDAKGRFTLDIPGDHVTLDISFVGYRQIQITAYKGKPVTVLLPLAEDTTQDVVVVAYGKQKKQSMVASITTINPKELRGYTWSRELAQAIVFTSPFLCYADNPTNYLKISALDVMKAIPSVWDETIVLPGSDIGKCAAFARRSGKTWFIAVINGADTTTLDMPLDFLGRGKYRMIQLGDVPDRDDAWQRDEKSAKRGDSVHLALRRGGGCVIQLNPAR